MNVPPLRHSGNCPRVVFALTFLAIVAALSAQPVTTGTIEGRVLNATSGNYLNNARVAVKGSLLAATTDENGEYRLAGVAAGPITLSVTYTGLDSQTRVITVSPGAVARADFELVLAGSFRAAGEIVQLEKFTVEERELTAQGQALHEQRTAANIKNVVSIEEFGDLGITNPGHFLSYVPGISNVYNTTGEVEGIGVRGMASSGTVVMFDGAEAASNDPNSRAYNFSGTSVANIDRIEVTKVPTPDLPANAVGGSINMISKSGFLRSTPLLRYNTFLTLQAKGTQGNLPPFFRDFAGTDSRTTMRPVQPGFDFSYSLPWRKSLAFTLNLGHNARYQDREYQLATWDRIRLLQTAGSMYSVINIFTKDLAALGADWKVGKSLFRARLDSTLQNAYTRSSVYSYNFGSGATGGPNYTNGAATAGGSLGQSSGAHLNQYRRLINGRLSYTYSGDKWKFDARASYSESRRTFSDMEDGLFYTVATTLSGVIVSAQGLDGINTMTMPQLTVKTRTGEPVDPFDVRQYTMNTATSGRLYFQNVIKGAGVDATRTLAAPIPLVLKAGASVATTARDNWTESMTWNIRPPASAGGQLVGNYDLLADAFNARRTFNGGTRILWLSNAKVYDLYKQHPDWFQLNETGAYTNRVNNSKKLQETIAAGYLRSELRAFENRFWLVAGVRFERTMDEGYGPLNDIRNTYRRDAAGRIELGSNGRPEVITADAMTLAKLQYKERGAYNERNYQGYYPSLNASYNLGRNFVLRSAYARTIGRPDVGSITPGTTISDPSVASPTISVVNVGLQPWTSDNYDLTLDSYELKGATLSLSGFRKEVTNFFTSLRIPATAALLDQFGLPEGLDPENYTIVSTRNSPEQANVNGLEWSWRQSLRPLTRLPLWARSIGFRVNGTHLRLSGPGADNFLGYSTRVINYGIDFTRGNFALKLNANSSNGPITARVAASSTTPAGTYTATAPRTIVSGSLEYRLTKRITFHLSGQNLNYSYWRQMNFSPGVPDYARPTQFRDNGVEYVVGIKGEF